MDILGYFVFFQLLESVPVPCLPASLVLCGSWNKLCIFTSLFFDTVHFHCHSYLFCQSSLITPSWGWVLGVFHMPPLHSFFQPSCSTVLCIACLPLSLDCELWTMSSLWAVLASSLSCYVYSCFYTGIFFLSSFSESNSTFSILV